MCVCGTKSPLDVTRSSSGQILNTHVVKCPFMTLFCPSDFSQQNTGEQRELKDPARDPQYSEPQIDAMRAQKDQVAHLDHPHAGVVLLYRCTHMLYTLVLLVKHIINCCNQCHYWWGGFMMINPFYFTYLCFVALTFDLTLKRSTVRGSRKILKRLRGKCQCCNVINGLNWMTSFKCLWYLITVIYNILFYVHITWVPYFGERI